jgi:hypothetical protein
MPRPVPAAALSRPRPQPRLRPHGRCQTSGFNSKPPSQPDISADAAPHRSIATAASPPRAPLSRLSCSDGVARRRRSVASGGCDNNDHIGSSISAPSLAVAPLLPHAHRLASPHAPSTATAGRLPRFHVATTILLVVSSLARVFHLKRQGSNCCYSPRGGCSSWSLAPPEHSASRLAARQRAPNSESEAHRESHAPWNVPRLALVHEKNA